MDAVAQPLIHGEGTREHRWRHFAALQSAPRLTTADLLPGGGRAIVVAPHPDDETLGAGATLRTLASLGHPTVLISVTRGEGSHPGSMAWPLHALGSMRLAERDTGLRRLGWQPERVVELNIADGKVSAQEARLCEVLLSIVTDADTVFAPWRHDGHPDHDAVGRAGARACAQSGATLFEFPIWMWHWAVPDDPRVPWSRARRFACSAKTREAKQAAILAHVSQLGADPSTGQPPVLAPSTLERFSRDFEVFFS